MNRRGLEQSITKLEIIKELSRRELIKEPVASELQKAIVGDLLSAKDISSEDVVNVLHTKESNEGMPIKAKGKYPEPLTPKSLPTPNDQENNFWYVFNDSPTVIVFVHGIFSDSRGCWLFHNSETSERVFWPDLIYEDNRFDSPSIYLAGYHTKITEGDFPIAQCAREILENIRMVDTNGTPAVLDKQNVIFVCHSTGGIVVRYLLERSEELFRDKGVGIALIASPSLGSVWANVAALAAKYYNQRLGLQLRKGGAEIEDVRGRFQDLVNQRVKRMPKLFGMEACETKMILRDRIPRWIQWVLPNRLRVVNTISAGQHFGEVKYLPDTDHFSSVKPNGLNHPSHKFIVTFMIEFRKEILMEIENTTTGHSLS